ncbi:hypothetical protein [Streptomyces sp. NPDC048341]|uniref:hypothetical protein n=1 Tax=Streptomyces sp. NPDC048341 TaxID=3154620 RepID=UPI00341D7852
MSLPVIAIVVSTASALFTASNMLTSVLTYRRVHPRLKVRIRWQERDASESPELQVQVISLSATKAKIKDVQLLSRYRKNNKSLIGRALSAGPPGVIEPFRKNYRLVSRDGDSLPKIGASLKEENELLPFEGAWWDFPNPSASLDEWWTHLAVQVTLTNGRRKRSNWLMQPNVNRAAYAMATIFGMGELGREMEQRYRADQWAEIEGKQ